MKRALILAVLIACLAGSAYAIEALTPKDFSGVPNNQNPQNFMRAWTMGAKLLTSAGACTTAPMDGHGFKYWATYLVRNKNTEGDSAHVNIERQRSFNGSSWVKIDSLPYAGATADTLGVITDWSTTATLEPALYYRFIIRAENDTNSTNIATFIIVAQQ